MYRLESIDLRSQVSYPSNFAFVSFFPNRIEYTFVNLCSVSVLSRAKLYLVLFDVFTRGFDQKEADDGAENDHACDMLCSR